MCDNGKIFINAVLKRKEENKKAFSWLMEEKLYSLIGSILRLELDSLIRVAYLNSINDINQMECLLKQFNKGKRWKYEKQLITDRAMLNNVMWNLGLGWAQPIYDICCAFIHLSPYHDWGEIEPTRAISDLERSSIVQYVKEQQNICLANDFEFSDLVKISSGVFDKLHRNLECEIENFKQKFA